ncbi:MAG: ATP-dependent acyl-CoA ligase [Xanthobacteraceae bacterium]
MIGPTQKRESDAAAPAQNLATSFPARDRSVPSILRRQAERYGDRTLFSCLGVSWTFAQAAEEAARWAGVLRGEGLSRGDRLAIMCSNRIEFMQLFLGCTWLGAVAVPINTASRGFQLQHILENSGARLLCVETALGSIFDTIEIDKLPLERIYLIGDDEAAVPEIHRLAQRLPAPGEAAAVADIGPGDLLAILYTSGTTGPSKGVCSPHAQYFWWGVYTGRQLGVTEGDILHTTLPLFHTNALNSFFQALLYGATQVVEARFSVSRFWEALARSEATITYVLGAMVPMLLSKEPSPAEKSHRVRVALAPGVPAHFHEQFTSRTGIILLDSYGATESNAVIGTDARSRRPGYMGVVAEGFEARVVDDNDEAVGDGVAGELLLRADEPYAFASGYYGMPEHTVAAWRNLWLHTGDRVVRSADGYFRFIDRMKDSIRRRGENISSFEVEQILLSHPAIAVAAVFPVQSDLAEDEVMTTVVLKDGASFSEEELIRYCEKRMPYFSIPRFVELADELPRTESGKIQKFKLRERGCTATTWDREAAGIKINR